MIDRQTIETGMYEAMRRAAVQLPPDVEARLQAAFEEGDGAPGEPGVRRASGVFLQAESRPHSGGERSSGAACIMSLPIRTTDLMNKGL